MTGSAISELRVARPPVMVGPIRDFDQPAQALGGFPAGLRAIDIIEQSGQFSRACHRRQGRGLVGRRPIRHHQGIVEEVLSRHRHAAIGHRHRAVGIDGADKLIGEPFRRHPLELRLQQPVRRHLDIEFDDDSKQAVAAHRQSEQFGVLAAGTLHQGSVRQHHADRLHGGAERPMRHRPTMGVDTERASDAEIAVGLHHRRREALRIEHADDIRTSGFPPTCGRSSRRCPSPKRPPSSVIAVPSRGRLWPPIECRATEAATGRFEAAASLSSARMRSIRSFQPGFEIVVCFATGVGLSRLASLRMVRCVAAAGEMPAKGSATVAAAARRNFLLDCMGLSDETSILNTRRKGDFCRLPHDRYRVTPTWRR